MTTPEQIAILKSHYKSLEEASTFEAFKAQQLAYVSFLIDQLELEEKAADRILNWVVRAEVHS